MKAFIKDAPFGVSVIFIILAIGFAYIALPFFGNSALIVRSGSMQPQIAVGDLAVVKKQADGNYKAGDIIAFKNANNSKTLTTHRIAGIENKNGRFFYQTKGDANKTVDRELVSTENVIGKAYFRLPYLGKLIAFAKTTAGFSLAVIFPALLVIAFEIVNIFKEIRKQKAISGHQPPTNSETQLLGPIIDVLDFSPLQSRNKLRFKFPGFRVLLPILASTLLVYSSFAFFSDTETSTGNVFTASTSFPSLSPCIATDGTGIVVINEINWGASNGDGLDEWIELCNTTNSPIDLTNWVVENLGVGGPNADITITGGTIPANSFFLIARKGKNDSRINVDPDFIETVSLVDSGEQLILKNNTGTIIDTANGTGAWLAGSNSTPKKSMERKSPVGSGTVSGSW